MIVTMAVVYPSCQPLFHLPSHPSVPPVGLCRPRRCAMACGKACHVSSCRGMRYSWTEVPWAVQRTVKHPEISPAFRNQIKFRPFWKKMIM